MNPYLKLDRLVLLPLQHETIGGVYGFQSRFSRLTALRVLIITNTPYHLLLNLATDVRIELTLAPSKGVVLPLY